MRISSGWFVKSQLLPSVRVSTGSDMALLRSSVQLGVVWSTCSYVQGGGGELTILGEALNPENPKPKTLKTLNPKSPKTPSNTLNPKNPKPCCNGTRGHVETCRLPGPDRQPTTLCETKKKKSSSPRSSGLLLRNLG